MAIMIPNALSPDIKSAAEKHLTGSRMHQERKIGLYYTPWEFQRTSE